VEYGELTEKNQVNPVILSNIAELIPSILVFIQVIEGCPHRRKGEEDEVQSWN